jgi:D-amino peptidase
MRVLISVDMEGISGVTHWDHVTPNRSEYARFRSIMTDEANAAIEGAFNGGADQVIVVDGHYEGSNILMEKLDPRAKLITGSPAPLSMVDGVQNSDVALFIGYHARSGTPNAILDHTWSDRVRFLSINDREIGEIGFNAAVCGSLNVPIVFVSGDRAACDEAIDLLGKIETVAVKSAVGRLAAECLSINEAHQMIREAAARAIKQRPALFTFTPPLQVVVEFAHTGHIDRALRIPGTHRLSGTRIEFQSTTILSAYNTFRAIVAIAGD